MAESSFKIRDIATDSGSVLNNPIHGATLLREARAQGVWEQMTTEVEVKNGGYVTANINVGSTGVVKRVTIPDTAGSRQFRSAYMLDASGKETYGQNIPTLGDKVGFLYNEIEIGLRRTPQFAEHSDIQKRDGQNSLKLAGGSEAIAQQQVKQFAGRQINADHYAALLRGADDLTLSAEAGALNKNLGGANNGDAAGTGENTFAGSQILHENFVMFDGTAAGGTVTHRLDKATGAKASVRRAHETAVATTLLAMQGLTAPADIAKNVLDRDSIAGLKFYASEWDIKRLMGKNHDHILLMDSKVADSLLGSLEGDEKATLVGILKMLANGTATKQDIMDYRVDNLIIDGVLIVPDRTLDGWRPATIATPAAGHKVVYGASAVTQSSYWGVDKHRAYETNNQNTGISFLLGDSAIVHATDGSLEMMMEEGPFKTGRSWAGQEWRTLRRAVWNGRDSANADQIRNESSIQVFSRIAQTIGKL